MQAQPHWCSSCGVAKGKKHFTKSQLEKKCSARRCKQCVDGVVTPTAAAASSRGSGGHGTDQQQRRQAQGLVRVKDVQRHYGHLCQIPLQAYIEANVASSWNDWVSEEDVERASDAWDARSIAHEIDTQWGAMPWGGAYKDSNRYYGPGEYDFY